MSFTTKSVVIQGRNKSKILIEGPKEDKAILGAALLEMIFLSVIVSEKKEKERAQS